MGSDKETRLQRYLRFFADHRLFSIVILTAIIVAGIGTFAGNLKSIISLVPEKPPSSNVTLLMNVKNADVDSIKEEIRRFRILPCGRRGRDHSGIPKRASVTCPCR